MPTFDDHKSATVENLMEYVHHSTHGFHAELITKQHRIDSVLSLNETNRPSLNLVGFFDHFSSKRIQIIGRGEYSVLMNNPDKNHQANIKKFFEYPIPCIFFSHDNRPDSSFIELAEEKKVAIFISNLSTNDLTNRLYDFFSDYLCVNEVVHGLMMEIFGIGVLIKISESSTSQLSLSEYGLELIKRGHCLVADDVVNLKKQKGQHLIAFTSDMITHHMEIMGIGIINVAHLFGVKSILHQKSVDLIIEIEPFNAEHSYDMEGRETQYKKILDVPTPILLIPIPQGVNIPILIETATMNHRLKMTGYNPGEEFNKRIIEYTNRTKPSNQSKN